MNKFDGRGDESECYRRVREKIKATVIAPKIPRVSESSEGRGDGDRELEQWYTQNH